VPRWVRQELGLPRDRERMLLDGIEELTARHERLWEASKTAAINALVASFTERMNRLRQELSARDATVANITQYFERLVSDLTNRARQDPKTRLMNFNAFVDQVQFYLTHEQRGRWCAVGLVDLRAFKFYNDTLGHEVGDRLIEAVARLLALHVRAEDLVARDEGNGRELHARFGGDEFCFLIPNLDDPAIAAGIANRFAAAVAGYDWAGIDERLGKRPLRVDIGVACFLLGRLTDRRKAGGQLVQDLLVHADRLMYDAKAAQASQAYPIALRLEDGTLVPA
jgi:diguanylate cyclase (GGDEF)-like protein